MAARDVVSVDDDLLMRFHETCARCLEPFRGGATEIFSRDYQALLSFLLWATCVLQGRQTPGMTMMKLRYAFPRAHNGNIDHSSHYRRIQLGCLLVAAPLFFWRLRRYGLSNGWSSLPHSSVYSKIWRMLEGAGGVWQYACLFNAVGFLRDSSHRCYPYVSHRLVDVGLSSSAAWAATGNTIYQSPTCNRALPNFQFVNRQLLWDHTTTCALGATSLLACVSSLLQATSVYRTRSHSAMRRIQKLSSWFRHHITGMALSTSIATSREALLSTASDYRACGKCSIIPAKNPYLASCSHTYCYYCIKTACMAEPACFACVGCRSPFLSSSPSVGVKAPLLTIST